MKWKKNTFPGFKAFIDSSELEIPRPENKRKRKRYYCGKKKKHAIKTRFDGIIDEFDEYFYMSKLNIKIVLND